MTSLNRISKDNITCIVVLFDWIEEEKDKKEREAMKDQVFGILSLSLSLFRAAVPHSHAVYVRIDEKKVEVKEEAAFTYGIFESHLEKGSGVSGQPVRRLAFIISHLSLTFSVFLS